MAEPVEQPTLASFDELLAAARTQEEPQRLLFVFARKFVDDHVSETERQQYRDQRGGLIQPCLCVDKTVDEVTNFGSLREESERVGTYWWDIVFVSSMSGRGGIAPNSDEAVQPLQFMVNAINQGRTERMVAFDRHGQYLQFA
ncbi:MAG TPA: hypothetical protein VFQ88_06695 [Nevskiaceae bacterium]|nr:hypothetical protein [Nevskiaceae bacterium]